MTKCKNGDVHVLDPERCSICPGCKMVHFYCVKCNAEIASMPLRDAPKRTRDLALELHEALEDG